LALASTASVGEGAIFFAQEDKYSELMIVVEEKKWKAQIEQDDLV
jgi:hypothetical protein